MENVLLNIAKGKNDEKITSVFSPGKQANFLGISPLKGVEVKSEGRPFRVSIEGNIGAGKSTCIEYCEKLASVETYAVALIFGVAGALREDELLRLQRKDVKDMGSKFLVTVNSSKSHSNRIFTVEPIEWWRDVDGNNLLELLYSDINTWISVFQSYVQLSRLKVQTTKPQKPDTKVQIFERSIQNNRFCFLEHAYRKGSLNSADYAVLDQWYRWIRENVDINLDLIVYLRTTPEVVYERVKKRNRPEETGLSLQYLKDLHESHEKWLMSNDERFNTVPLLVLDGNKPLEEMVEQYKLFENQILGKETRGLKRTNTADQDLGRVKKNLKEDL